MTKCFEDTELHKPDPEPYLAVLDAMGVSPGEAVAFEDSPNGVAAARAAGIFCVAVPNPMTQCLSLAHADLCLKSLADEPLRQLLSRACETEKRVKPVRKLRAFATLVCSLRVDQFGKKGSARVSPSLTNPLAKIRRSNSGSSIEGEL